MRELDSKQLMQVSGGIILGVSDADTYHLALVPGDLFIFANYKTGDIYLFGSEGEVSFTNPFSDTSYSVSFPFKMVNEFVCEYSVPSSFFK